jgi:hypothetical protein
MALYEVQKELTIWITQEVQADTHEEAITKAETNREWNDIDNQYGDATGHYWTQNLTTHDIYYTKGEN